MSNPENNSSQSKPIRTARPDVGAKYEIRVATLVAAILSTNAQIENYQIFTNLEETLPFDDVVVKVYFKGETTPHALIMQVKHLLRGELLNVEKYLKGYCNIVKAAGLQTIIDIDVNNIHFCYFSVKDVWTTKEYKLLPHNSTNEWWRLAFPFQHCQKLFIRRNINETDNKERKDFLDKFCLYFYQPGMDLIEERIIEICKMNDAADIFKYVDRFFEKDELWRKGLSKAVFETELLKIRLSDYILSPEDVIQLNELPVAIWNKLTLLHDVTIVEDEAYIEKCLYGCLTQMLNRLLNNAVEWNEHERKKLNSTVISKFKELFTEDEPVMVRHWISPPTTLKELIIELWKCGKLPLILKTEEELSVLKAYAHLHKKYIIITKKLVIRREEIDKYPLSVFTRISDVNKCLEVRDELLRAISVSIHGRKPITFYSMVNGHEELTETLSCAHILHLMKSREVYLSKECLDIEQHDMIFLINDPNCTAEYNIDSVNKIKGNTAIWCRPDDRTKYRQEIEKIPKLEGYEIYHCTASSENENFTLNEGNEMLLRDYFVDQYGESVYNLEGDIVPILGNNFRSIQQNYIPRFLCNAVVCKSLFDSPPEKGICFFSGDLTCLDVDIKKYILELFLDITEQEIYLSTENHCIRVRSEDINTYWIKASKLKRPLLHIHVKGSDMYLSKYKNWNGLSNHISYTGQKIPEATFLTELKGEITVLTGEPGIGKSSLLRSLFKNHGLEKYILFYNLTDYKEKNKNKLRDINSSLDFILNKVKDTRYSEFLSNLFKRKEKLLVVLDSFDETLPSRKEDILNFIRNLVANNIQIIIASRFIANYILMDNFEVNVFKVDILNEENHKEYIKNSKLGEEILATIPPEFLENPLYLNLLKLIFKEGVHLPDVNKFAIFESIVRIKLNEHFEKFFSSDLESDKECYLEPVLEKHFQLALVRIIGVDAVEKLLRWTCEKQLSNQMKLGIILSIDEDGFPTFVHETFAEYVTAAWIVKNKNKDSAKKIYMEMLNQKKLYVLDILCEHMQLHKAVLESELEKVEMYTKDRSHLEETDALGRTALHVFVARYNHQWSSYSVQVRLLLHTIISSMQKLKVTYTCSDDLMEWDWVQHKHKGNCIFYDSEIKDIDSVPILEAYVNCIVQKLGAGVELSIHNKKGEYDAENAFEKAIKAARINLIRDLYGMRILLQSSKYIDCQTNELEIDELNLETVSGLTSLHLACLGLHHIGAATGMVINGHDVNSTDNYGCTPLHYSVMNPPPVCVNMTKNLIKAGAKTDVTNKWKDSPINIAVRCRNTDLVKLLLQKVDIRHSRGKEIVRLCLFLALEIGDQNMVELLLQYQPDADIVNKDYLSALLFFSIIHTYSLHKSKFYKEDKPWLLISAKQSYLECMKLILEYGANANGTLEVARLSYILTPVNAGIMTTYELVTYTNELVRKCHTPLMLASAGGSSDLAMLLLEKGASVNSTTTDGETALIFASEANSFDVSKLLLEKNASVDATTVYGRTALILASGNGSLKIAKLLIEKGASVNSTTTDGNTALMFASGNGSLKIAKLLIEKGASVNSTTTDGETALMFAIDSEIAKLLIEKGASVNSTTTDGRTPLMFAAVYGHLDILKLLLEKGAHVNSTTIDGRTPLIFAFQNRTSYHAKLFQENGDAVNSTTANGETPLMRAARCNYIDIVKLLLEKGADINTTTSDGKTLLMFASEMGRLDVVQLLLEKGTDINTATVWGKTALIFSLTKNWQNSQITELLLMKGADVNHITKSGRTALFFAIEGANVRDTELLLQRGANVNSTTSNGETPLHYVLKWGVRKTITFESGYPMERNRLSHSTIEEGHVKIVKLLLEYGADVNRSARHGKTPFYYAIEQGRAKVVKLLLEHGAGANKPVRHGKTPLYHAIKKGWVNTVKLLLEHGADVNRPVIHGKTPLYFAVELNRKKIIKLLLAYGAKDRKVKLLRLKASILKRSKYFRKMYQRQQHTNR